MLEKECGRGGGAYQVCSNNDPRFPLDLLNVKFAS